jgi:hypothetical protein
VSTDKSVDGKKCKIIPVDRGGAVFALTVDGTELRRSSVPRLLSNWALDNGAKEVDWDFDLKLAES